MSADKYARNSLTVQDINRSENRIKQVADKSKQHHIEYGIIDKINLMTSQVSLKYLNGKEFKTTRRNGKVEQEYYTVATPMTEINMKYGALRKGLKVRIHWVGENEPEGHVIVEVLSNNENLVVQDYALPDIEVGFSMPF
ncbi:hypothetical protein CMI41_03785 [Candidatus Pacearchaeota archaeon]|nr:hypothetical protein [Candidatus Pacearchaeota archaeon]|tara:strand:- start:10089 stop:10508 length:420 start_codon:yes stop_codon:yes gene_type:complete